jgi:hypothetical protein
MVRKLGMKKTISVFLVLITMVSLVTTTVLAAPTAMLTQTAELGQLKVCKVAGSGVEQGTSFTFKVNGSMYSVPAGPADRNGYCILAGQYPVNSQVTIEEVIPGGYYVSRIEVKPDRTISKDIDQGTVTVNIVSGVIEAIFTNRATGSPTRTPTSTTPRPTKTATSTPECDPNCTPTATPIPMGRLQICKEAEGSGVTGTFTFQFENRSRSVPVGACAGLISVEAGTLTITETSQAGFSVADIYTIPADRLISKDPSGGSARIRIVEGTVVSQTIVIFRNRAGTTTHTSTPTGSATATVTNTATPTGSTTATATHTATSTPTSTNTLTPTPTTPPTVCPPAVIFANFRDVLPGQSVQGLGKVAPFLEITAKGNAIKVSQAAEPNVYFAPNQTTNGNGGLSGDGGFSDVITRDAVPPQPQLYTFTFAPGVSVTNFSLHMLDYGDYNPTLSTSHYVSLTAFDAGNNAVAMQELSYTTPAQGNPRSSDLYGDLRFNGDAVTAPLGQPGNYLWNVSGSGIVRVVLEFGAGFDPNVAFDLLSFTTECSSCQSFFTADLNQVAAGQSVEGLGRVAPHLDIQAKREAQRVLQAITPNVYFAPNQTTNGNGGLVADGGFSDVPTQMLREAHEYTFTFAPGVTVTNFTLHMLDYGDLNEPRDTSHYVSMKAYGASNNLIAQQELSFTTPPDMNPRSSNLYGDLRFTGDAVTAARGQPGNYLWNVSGNGIVRVVLEFGAGYDQNIAFDLLSYHIVCQ